MAMGVSSIQPTPLRPCCPSYFTLLQSSPRHSTMGFSYRSFSASSKALHRRETCTVWSCSQNITMSNTSIQFRQDIFYHNNSLVEAKPLSGGSLSSSFKPLGCQAWVVEAERLRHSKKECIFSQSKGLVGSKTSSITNIRKDTKQELQSLPDGRDGAKSESYTTNFEDTLSRTQTSKSPDQPYIQDQMFAQSGKYDVDAQNVGSYMMPYGHNRSVSVKKVNSHRIDGSEKLNLFPVQCSEKAVKCNGMVSNMEVKSNSGSERRIHEVSDTNGRDIGIAYFKFTNLSGESEIIQEDPNAECAMIHSDQGGTYRKPSLFQTRDTWSRTQARMAQPQPHMQDQTFLQNGKKVNGHIIYGSDKLVLSSAQRLEKAVKSSETISEKSMEFITKTEYVPSTFEASEVISRDKKGKKSLKNPNGSGASDMTQADLCARLASLYSEILVVDSVSVAKDVVRLLTGRYRHLVHACDTEVAKIDVKKETPVDHGEIICFSIYSGPEADFGNGKSCLWVDVLDGGGRELLLLFAPFFEDPSIKKVWHNYSFDNHVVENYGFKVSGFHADTMHMARLWDSSRRAKGGYSLEALTGDPKIMSGAKLCQEKNLFGKISMKTIFGRKKMKKDGNEGKIIGIAPVEELQREERIPWICYSALDAISTLKLYESLKNQLSNKPWQIDGNLAPGKSMFDFYEKYWRPFGEILVKMETEGMLVDRAYLAEIEKWAKAEQEVAGNRFRKWASKYCADAMYMNVGSDAQLRQLLFGGSMNRKDQNQRLPLERKFKIPNVDKVIEEGKKVPTKYRNMTLHSIGVNLKAEMYTETGWPSVSGDALKMLAGKVASEFYFLEDAQSDDDIGDNSGEITAGILEEKPNKPEHIDKSSYGTAFEAFENPEDGREACHAIAALCQMCSIDTLISNFILPLQSSNISGRNGRIHCSLNINTETGRLSARRPNLQNQPALEKDRYKIRQAFIAAPGNSLIVADYGQLELRILAHLTNCKSMLDAFKVGGDFHSRTALNMYPHIREAIEDKQVLLEWDPQPGEDKPPVPLLKDVFASERKKAKQLNFSIAYGKTPVGLALDWKVSVEEARKTVDLWYNERKEVLTWQEQRKEEAHRDGCVCTLLGRARWFPSLNRANRSQIGHVERAAINTPVQGSAADVAMCAMLEISNNARLKELGWRLLLQVHDEVILEGPSESGEIAKNIVVECMSKPFNGKNFLNVDLVVDAKCAQNWYAAK